MDRDSFITLCKGKEYPSQALLLFEQAIDFARIFLKEKKRLAGDSYLEHNLRVAKTLVENKAEPEVVVAGILHGLLRECSEERISKQFGEEICHLLKGASDLQEIKSKNEQMNSEALRRIIITALEDVRVIFVKLANKLHNIESIHVFPPEDQERMAQEVLDVYAPLASRLGMDKIRVLLEERAFRILNPRKFKEIQEFLEESREDRIKSNQIVLQEIIHLAQGKVQIKKLKGRPKHIYSIYKKITKRGVKLDNQYDLQGVRAIVPTVKDCYTLLGLLHQNYEPIEGRLKDYIANPKPNYYRSLHTGILWRNKVIEVQIRTPEMEEFAEEGIASHWAYKGMKSDKSFEKKIAWLRGVFDLQKKGKEFVESIKVDVFGDKIYCYTPKGDLKELPVGSTILDFAYLVHEEIGNTCIGGRVNGKFVPIKHTLEKGDIVEVITHKKQRPRRGWVKIVTSAKARQKIRKNLKQYEHLPSFHFRPLKPLVTKETGILVESTEFPKAICVLAKCCRPIPGDEIVGILTKRRIISSHKRECKLALRDESRWIPVNWKRRFSQRIHFFVEAAERSGLLADLLNTIARAGFEVKGAKAKLLGVDARCSFLVIPRDLNHLQELVKKVKKVKGVKNLYFE